MRKDNLTFQAAFGALCSAEPGSVRVVRGSKEHDVTGYVLSKQGRLRLNRPGMSDEEQLVASANNVTEQLLRGDLGSNIGYYVLTPADFVASDWVVTDEELEDLDGPSMAEQLAAMFGINLAELDGVELPYDDDAYDDDYADEYIADDDRF